MKCRLRVKRKWLNRNGTSVLPSTADMRQLHRHVGFVPIGDKAGSELACLANEIECCLSQTKSVLVRRVYRLLERPPENRALP